MKLIASFFFLTMCMVGWSQDNIETEIKARNVFELSIIDIYPENYPNVSVIFQAKNKEGKPLWLLKKSEVSITENGGDCEVTRLINITENKPINIGLVFDYSSSMFYNPAYSEDSVQWVSNLYFSGNPVPSWYTMAIDYGKQGILEFMSTMEHSDSVLFVGFSSRPDKISPLSNNLKGLESFIKSVQPDGGTAFYDALYIALDSLSAHNSSSAIVALTDGGDNASDHTYQEVIAKSLEKGIPIYIIGLGDIDPEILKKICKATDGFFYETNDPKQLKTIYANIKSQLKSIYQVDYTSNSDDFSSETRTLKFSFLNDTLSFSNPKSKFSLPEEARAYLKEKENERIQQIENDRQEAFNKKLLWGGIAGGVLLLGIGSFLVVRRTKVKLKLEEIYPNPFSDVVNVRYEVSETITNPELKIVDLRGNKVVTLPISNQETETTVDTSGLRRGVYIFSMRGGGKNSASIKGVKK